MHVYVHVLISVHATAQARTKGLLWKTKVLEKKKATQLNLSGPQDNLNRTIIDGATVSTSNNHAHRALQSILEPTEFKSVNPIGPYTGSIFRRARAGSIEPALMRMESTRT